MKQQEKPDHDGATAMPAPDHAAIRSHVKLMHTLAKSAGVEGILTLTRIDANNKTHTERFAIGEVDLMANAIIGWSMHPNLNVYAAYAIFRKDLPPGAKGAEADVRAVLAFVGDLDSDIGKTGVGLDELPLPAPYVVETSADNFHAVYPLGKAMSPLDAKPVAVALSNAIGGDSGTKDVSHLWRIPGTLNWPSARKLKRGRPSTPQLVTIKSAWEGELVELDDLQEALEDFTRPAGDPSSSSNTAGGSPEAFDDLPAYLKKLIAAPTYPGEDRSRTTGSVMWSLFRRGWSDDAVQALFEAYPNGIGERFAEGKTNLRKEIERLRQKFDEKIAPDEPAKGPAAILDEIDEAMDWTQPGGLLGEITDWILLTSRRPNRPMAVAAALAVLSAVCGRHLYGPTGTSLNLYLACLAGTAMGKDRPLSAVAEILAAAKLWNLQTTAKGFSVSALEQMMIEHPSCVATCDEIGASLLARMGHKHASTHEQGMRGVLLELWSRNQSKPPFPTTRHAKQKGTNDPGTISIPWPNLTLFGVSTEEAFYKSITSGSIRDGFLNRFLLCTAAPRSASQDVPEQACKVPDEITHAIHKLVPDMRHLGVLAVSKGPFHIEAELDSVIRRLPWESDAVREKAAAFEEKMLAIIDANIEQAPLLGRVFEYAVRLASLHAVSRDGTRNATVTMEDFSWGASLAIQSARFMIDGAISLMASNEYEARFNLIRNVIREAGEIKQYELLRRVRSINARERDDVITHLTQAGWIKEVPIGTKGRTALGWKWL